MLDFIKENWRLIIDIISCIVVVVFFFIRKKPIKIVDSVKACIIDKLPEVINAVENYKDVFDPLRKLSGEEKLTMALSILKTYLVDELGLKEEDLPLYTSWLVQHIEDILSTPQKKGVVEDGTK